MPPADLYEREGQWVVRVELPEVDLNEISLSMIDKQLVIEGERKPPEGFKPENSIFQECPYGPFERVITLPAPVPENQIQARHHQGVLYITLPAMKEQGKKIEIQSEAPQEDISDAA